MKRLSATIAVAVLLGAGALTGCSGGDGSNYCNRVRDNAKNDTLEKIDASTASGLKQLGAETTKLRSDAPSELQGEYDLVVDAYNNPEQADREEVTAAVNKIMAYDEDHCDVEYKNS